MNAQTVTLHELVASVSIRDGVKTKLRKYRVHLTKGNQYVGEKAVDCDYENGFFGRFSHRLPADEIMRVKKSSFRDMPDMVIRTIYFVDTAHEQQAVTMLRDELATVLTNMKDTAIKMMDIWTSRHSTQTPLK